MTIATGQVTVTTTATQIVAARAGRTALRIRGLLVGDVEMFLGVDNTVTVATGYAPGEAGFPEYNIENVVSAVWAILPTGSRTIQFLEIFP